jgi:alpha-maltose-1-phosphate synthase
LNSNIILSHSGKQHVYHVAKALKNLNYLHSFYTSGYISNKVIQSAIDILNISFLKKRYESGLWGNNIHSNWQFELPEYFARYIQKKDENYLTNLMIERDVSFGKYMEKVLIKEKFDIFWGYNGSSLEAIIKANEMGKMSICETQLAYIPFTKKILTEEALLHPEWADSVNFNNLPVNFEKRLEREPIEAKRVIAISSFLKSTLIDGGVDENKIDVLPLGFNINTVRYNKDKWKGLTNRPIKVLFAGRITQQKGIKYALEAIKHFKKSDIELHIIGIVHGGGKAFETYSDHYIYHGKMQQQELFSLYTDYDVLLFPSLSEGFGLVALEAMGAGLPVISTPNTNAFELIDHGKNGYVVPIRSVEAIVDALVQIRNMDEDTYREMSFSARQKAISYTWDTFQTRLGLTIESWKLA